jgi:tetratricopeptide (TPR) repeat protein
MIKKTFFILFAMTLLCACQRNGQTVRQLEQAERMMQQHPDSALALLDIIQPDAAPTSLNNAIWCLLITEAEEKCLIGHTSDSTINIAVNYFKQYDRSERYMLSLFYKGRVMEEMSQKDSALIYYKKALDVAYYKPKAKHFFLIYSRMGALLSSMHQQEEALNAYKNVCYYASQNNDNSAIAQAYINIGRIYSMTGHWTEAESYYQKAIQTAKQIHDKKELQSALFESVGLYIHTKRFKSASDYVHYLERTKGESSSFDFAKAYLTIGDQYRSAGQYDSAIVYLNKASHSADPSTRESAYQAFYYLYKNQNKFKEAIPYSNRYWNDVDSAQKLDKQKAAVEIARKYRSEKLYNETVTLRLKNTRIVMAGLILLLTFSVLTTIIVMIYQRRLMQRNRTINKIRQQLAELLQKVEDNETTIRNNKALIQQQENEKEMPHPEIGQLKQVNLELEQANQNLKEMIRERTRLLSAKDEKLIAMQQLAEERKEHPNILLRLKKEGKHLISDEDWEELLEMTDRMHTNFTQRLLLAYPSLKKNDVRFCCLLKQGYDAQKMAELLSITDESLTKRKQRLKKRLDNDKRWENGELETFIRDF